MNMETVAEIGYFIIRYIEKFQVDLGVGTGGDRPYPQVKFLPDADYEYDPSSYQIQKLEDDARRNLDRLSKDRVFKLDFAIA